MAPASTVGYHVQRDLEASMSGSEHSSSEQSGSSDEAVEMSSRRRILGGAFAAMLAVAVIACAAFLTSRPRDDSMSARQLFEDPQTLDVLTSNVISLDQRDRTEWASVRKEVESSAHGVTAQVRQELPHIYDELDEIQLSKRQQVAVLRHLRSVGDPRVRSVGQDIMDAIKETMTEDGDKNVLKRHLVEKLGPRMAEVRQLRDEYYPYHVGGPVDKGAALEASHLDGMRIVKDFDELRLRAVKLTEVRKLDDEVVIPVMTPGSVAVTTPSASFLGSMMTYFKDFVTNFTDTTAQFNPFNDDDAPSSDGTPGKGTNGEADYVNGSNNLAGCFMVAMKESTSDATDCVTEFTGSFSGRTFR